MVGRANNLHRKRRLRSTLQTTNPRVRAVHPWMSLAAAKSMLRVMALVWGSPQDMVRFQRVHPIVFVRKLCGRRLLH